MAYKQITGTFLDEITHDIPSQNWGSSEWCREFDTFVEAGIDTVIVIRSGFGEKLAVPSVSVAEHVSTLPVHVDLIRMFLELAGERNIKLYLGLYDSGYYWRRNDWQTEVEVNKAFIKEMHETFGQHSAFQGWYLPHETSDSSLRIVDINTSLAKEIRTLSDLPILVSPYFQARADESVAGPPRTPDEHARVWKEIFREYSGLIDYCAFQDGTADLSALAEITAATAEVAKENGIALWSNLETFDRDTPIKFPPIDWRKLAHKLDVVQPYVEKVVTFEFPHFLSPNSMWGSARDLYRRYHEHVSQRD